MSDFRFRNPHAPRRALASVVIAACVAAMVLGLSLWANARASATEVAALETTIARAQAARANPTAAADDTFHQGETPQLAQAAVQTALQTLADTHQVSVEVMQSDQIEQRDGIVRLNLAMTATAPEATLGAFLQDIADHRPALVISDVKLRRARGTRSEASRQIAVQLQLFGMQAP